MLRLWYNKMKGLKIMGRTSSQVKSRYNKKVYHTISVRLPKGWREQVKEAAKAAGESFAGYVRTAVETRMGMEGRPIKTDLLGRIRN